MEGPGWCTSIPEPEICYTHASPSLTLNAPNCPHRGVPSANLGGGALVGPASAHQSASAGLCCILGLLLVLPYGYPCAWHCVAPVRSMRH